LLDDATLAGILRNVFSLVPALDGGDSEERVSPDGGERTIVSAPTDALAAMMRARCAGSRYWPIRAQPTWTLSRQAERTPTSPVNWHA
jgi:hypothetical protein